MNTLEPEIQAAWHHFFEVVHTEEDWITPLLNSIDGVDATAAFWRPAGEVASTAAIVAHVTGHLEATLRAVLGMADQDYEDWPETPAPTDANWRAMRERLLLVVSDLRRALHNWSLEEIYGKPKGRQSKRSTMVTDILVHNAYHAGQIVKLKQAYAASKDLAAAL
jgi:hypothetical protein